MEEKTINVETKGIENDKKIYKINEFKNFDTLANYYIGKTEGVLTKIIINGKEIPLSFYDEIKNAYFEGGEDILLEISSKQFVLIDLTEQSINYILKIKENMEKFSKEVLLKSTEGYKMLNAIAEGIQSLLSILEQVSVFTSKTLYADDDIKKISKVINAIVESQKISDSIELSDIIDYDLPEIVDNIYTMFEEAERLLKNKKSN